MSGFRRLSDFELDRLSDEALVEYVVRARAAGDVAAMRLGLQILAYGFRELVAMRVRLKMEGRPQADVEAVTDAVLGGAALVAFRGESIGEFRALLSVVIKRRIADYYRSLRGQSDQEPLVEEQAGDEQIWGDILRAPEELDAVETKDLLDRVLDELSPPHRGAVDARLAGDSAREAAELVNNHHGAELPTPMTSQNVDQIFSRFRRRFRDLLEEADSGDANQNEDHDG